MAAFFFFGEPTCWWNCTTDPDICSDVLYY
jgi:hypothetical protein